MSSMYSLATTQIRQHKTKLKLKCRWEAVAPPSFRGTILDFQLKEWHFHVDIILFHTVLPSRIHVGTENINW